MGTTTRPPRPAKAATPKLTAEAVMELLRTTVPRLDELSDGVPQNRLTTVTDYGWSVNDQLAHLRACHDVLGGNMLRIVREDHPAWKAMSPRTWQDRTDYFEWKFAAAFEAFRAQRAELLDALEPLPPSAWERTATVSAPPGRSTSTASCTTATGWRATSTPPQPHGADPEGTRLRAALGPSGGRCPAR